MPRKITAATTYERICIYGGPKSGKSRLAATLARMERFGGTIAYVCADPPADALASVLPIDRPNLVVYEPRSEDPTKQVLGLGGYNPLIEASTLATKNWKKEDPEINTLVWDTMTSTGEDILSFVALTEQAPADSSEGRITFGKKGNNSYVVSPSRSDYGHGQFLIKSILRHLFGQHLHIVCLFHENYKEPKNPAEGTGTIGGPACCGSALIDKITGWFTSTIRLEPRARTIKKDGKQIKEMVRIARTNNHGIWRCGVRGPRPEPMPNVALNPDPINFWESYEDFRYGENNAS